jgi:hypothetical protein
VADLESILTKLAQRGAPAIRMMDGEWYCYVEMYVNAAGAKFKVASSFKHPSALSAAMECAERIDAMLRGFPDGAKAITHG